MATIRITPQAKMREETQNSRRELQDEPGRPAQAVLGDVATAILCVGVPLLILWMFGHSLAQTVQTHSAFELADLFRASF